MTPDEVVARAQELEGEEVLLTIRGRVHVDQHSTQLLGLATPRLLARQHVVMPDLVNIEPAPMRIEEGRLYADEDGDVFCGTEDGKLVGFGDGFRHDDGSLVGLRPVRVVDQ